MKPPPRKAAPEVQNFLHLLVQHRGLKDRSQPTSRVLVHKASSLLRDGPPPCPATVLGLLRRGPLEDLPLAASPAGWWHCRGDRFPCSMQKPRPGSRHLHAGRRLGSRQAPPRLVPEPRSAPVSTPLRFLTTRHQRFALARLPDPHLDAITAAPFRSAHHERPLTDAACGGLGPPPAGRPRRTYLHLLHSTASSDYDIAKPPSAFMAHDLRKQHESDTSRVYLDRSSPPVTSL